MKEEMEKRTWHYVQEPVVFDMHCDRCEGVNITWSEYVHKIWCYDCEIDTEGFKGIFDGPIPIHVSEMLGISFDIMNMKTGKIERFDSDSNEHIPMTAEEVKEKWVVRE